MNGFNETELEQSGNQIMQNNRGQNDDDGNKDNDINRECDIIEDSNGSLDYVCYQFFVRM